MGGSPTAIRPELPHRSPVYSGKDSRDCRALFKRHVANIPSHLMYRLCDHDDEILHIEFSHNGQLLATASRDGFSLVYDFVCTPPRLLHRISLDGGLGSVGSKVGWSPCDTYLAVSSIKRLTGQGCLELFEVNRERYTLLWRAASLTFDLYASMHKNGLLYGSLHNSPTDPLSNTLMNYTFEGECTGEICLDSTHCKEQKNQFHLPVCGDQWLTAITGTNAIQNDIIWLSRLELDNGTPRLLGEPSYKIESGPILSLRLTPNEDALLVNVRPYANDDWKKNLELDCSEFEQSVATAIKQECEVHMWSLMGGRIEMLGIYTGHRGFTPHDQPFVLFMETTEDSEYVASGSEDKCVHVWHKGHKRSHRLAGHTDVVNAVSWQKRVPGMLASGSDDGTVCVWGANAIQVEHESMGYSTDEDDEYEDDEFPVMDLCLEQD